MDNAHRVNLTLAWRLKPQLHKQNPPARVKRTLIQSALVRAPSGLRFCSREFHSPGLKLTPMGNAMPLPTFLSPILRATVYQGSFRSAIRSLAERDRGLFPISSSCGIIGFFVNTRKIDVPRSPCFTSRSSKL